MALVAVADLGRSRRSGCRSPGRARSRRSSPARSARVVSVIQRINAGKFELDYDVGRPYALFLGGLRPLIGGAFAMAISFAFTGGLLHLPVAAGESPTRPPPRAARHQLPRRASASAGRRTRSPPRCPRRERSPSRDRGRRDRAQPRRPAAARLRPHARSAADADRRPLQAARTRTDRQRDGDRPARPAAHGGRAARCRPARALRDARHPVLRVAQHAAVRLRGAAREGRRARAPAGPAFGGQGAGGLYSERPDRSIHVLGVELDHDRGLALVYGAALAGWSYLVRGARCARSTSHGRGAIGGILGVAVGLLVVAALVRITARDGEPAGAAARWRRRPNG